MSSWLHERRLDAACAVVRRCGACSVLDLGCGDGDLLIRLVTEPQIARIVGIDLDRAALRRLRERLDGMDTAARRVRVDLIHGSMTDGGRMFTGFDCAVLIETIEHLDPERLSALERTVFMDMRPTTVVVTTPNAEFNTLLGVPPHRFRHPDHRFEWGRERFRRWVEGVAARQRYDAACHDIAGRHPDLGGATQMAVFECAAPDRRCAG